MTPPECRDILDREGLQSPRLLTFAITGSCNLACAHCWVEAGAPSSALHVPFPIVRRLMEEFVLLGGTELRFTGGEPLVHPDCRALLQHACIVGFRRFSLQTNGMLLTDELVGVLAELDVSELSIQISLDGASAASHDLVRGNGAYRQVMAGITKLVRRGLGGRVSLFCTELHHNLDELPALLSLAESLGIGSVVTGALVRCGRAATSGVAPPDPEQYQRLLDRYEADDSFRSRYERIGNVAAIEWLRGRNHPRTECCTFVEHPYLAPDGRLFPCVLCHVDEYSVHGVFVKPLADSFAEGAPLWSRLALISASRSRGIAVCGECPAAPACAGGCMGRAWGGYGDLMSPDDRCSVRKHVYMRRHSGG